MDTFEGKTAVVTGAGSGMGRAMALRFAVAGANVVLADIDERTAQKVAAEIETGGGRAIAVQTDVADPAASDRLLSAALDEFGTVNVVIAPSSGSTR